MVTLAEKSSLGIQLTSVQRLFSSYFPLGGVNNNLWLGNKTDQSVDATSLDSHVALQSSEFIDLSSCMNDTQVTVPTLNG